ncbi:G domain-containing protein [Mycena sanguinolenta]|uniref:G domain-containing protein n=1 Tax=Mycena sanguinolenta TaxID=230812 RepID=A0A8H7CMU7_9AGAR|nr:G domain-containing protein [Mycena sanguinolenta]
MRASADGHSPRVLKLASFHMSGSRRVSDPSSHRAPSSTLSIAMAGTQDPRPTTEEMLKECPRFRILVVGKSGVGKSCLINHAFGINLATSPDQARGICRIEDEIISKHNERFVLHDSMGFEPGQTQNLMAAKQFLESHGEDVPLKDRVHAIWLCIQIPHAGGRVFETGDEEFLQLGTENMPVIVVFTQFDTLYSRMEEQLTDAECELSDEEIHALCLQRADAEFKEICVGVLTAINGSVQYARTSGLASNSPKRDQGALKNLIGITQNLVQGTVWYISAMAQRASAMEKINASIEYIVGMKRYWLSLGSSTELLGLKLENCMKLLHYDITASWNFDDDKLLDSDEFMNQIKSFAQLVTPPESEAKSWFSDQKGLYTLLGLAGSALVGVAVPALGVIGLSIAFTRWIANIYVNTPEVLRFLMAYMIDLTLVLDQLFLITLDQRPARRLTMDDIDLAVKNYRMSNTATVHNKIREYANKATVAEICRSTKAEEKVKELIKEYRAK